MELRVHGAYNTSSATSKLADCGKSNNVCCNIFISTQIDCLLSIMAYYGRQCARRLENAQLISYCRWTVCTLTIATASYLLVMWILVNRTIRCYDPVWDAFGLDGCGYDLESENCIIVRLWMCFAVVRVPVNDDSINRFIRASGMQLKRFNLSNMIRGRLSIYGQFLG